MVEEQSRPTLAEAAARFIAGLAGPEKAAYQQEVHRFVRWCGAQRLLEDLVPHDISTYAESLDTATTNIPQRLEAVRTFLAYLKKQGWTPTNLGVHLRIKKTGGRPLAPTGEGPQTIGLTPDGYQKLETELEELLRRRPQIAEEIRSAAADKDFRENAPLEAAKDYQGHIEGRIRELERILGAAMVVEAAEQKGHVQLGSTVEVRDLTYNEVVRYTIVSPSEADLSQGKISVDSPTGKALLNRAEGEEVEVKAPAGTVRYRVERILR